MPYIPSLKPYVDKHIKRLEEQQTTGGSEGGSGTTINDTTPSTTSTFSSQKINQLVNQKEPTIYKSAQAPTGIDVNDGDLWIETLTSPFKWHIRWGDAWNLMKGGADVQATNNLGLDQLIDVELGFPISDGMVLTLEGGYWKAKTPSASGGGSATKTTNILNIAPGVTDKSLKLKDKIYQVLFRKTVAGILPNRATDPTKAIASSESSTTPDTVGAKSEAFDTMDGSYWQTSETGAVGAWVGYDFTTPIEMHWIRLYQNTTSSYRSEDVSIEGSNDWDDTLKTGTWTEVYRWTFTSTADQNTSFEHDKGAFRFWRIKNNENLATARWRVHSFELSEGNSPHDIYRPLKESDPITIEIDESTLGETRIRNGGSVSVNLKIISL